MIGVAELVEPHREGQAPDLLPERHRPHVVSHRDGHRQRSRPAPEEPVLRLAGGEPDRHLCAREVRLGLLLAVLDVQVHSVHDLGRRLARPGELGDAVLVELGDDHFERHRGGGERPELAPSHVPELLPRDEVLRRARLLPRLRDRDLPVVIARELGRLLALLEQDAAVDRLQERDEAGDQQEQDAGVGDEDPDAGHGPPHPDDSPDEQVHEHEEHQQVGAGQHDRHGAPVVHEEDRLEVLVLDLVQAVVHLLERAQVRQQEQQEDQDRREPVRAEETERLFEDALVHGTDLDQWIDFMNRTKFARSRRTVSSGPTILMNRLPRSSTHTTPRSM